MSSAIACELLRRSLRQRTGLVEELADVLVVVTWHSASYELPRHAIEAGVLTGPDIGSQSGRDARRFSCDNRRDGAPIQSCLLPADITHSTPLESSLLLGRAERCCDRMWRQ